MEFIIGTAALIAIVWASVLYRTGGLFLGLLALLLVGTVFGQPFYRLEVGPLPVTFDRIILAGLILAYLLEWRFGRIRFKRLNRADGAFLAFLATLVISTFLHDWTVLDSRPLSQLLFWFLAPSLVYWIARDLPFGPRELAWLRGTLVGLACYLALTGMAEVHGQWWAVFPRYISSPEGLFFGRARGPFLNPMACGFFMSVGFFIAIDRWFQATRNSRLGWTLAIGLIGLGIYYTLTRSVWMGAGLGSLLVVGVSLPRRLRVPVFGGTLILGLAVLVTQWDRLVSFKRDVNLSAAETAESVKFRPILARIAWNMFQDRPFFGHGYGQYGVAHQTYLSDKTTELPLEKARKYSQHNTFLALLTETGLIGMGLYLITLTLWTAEAWRLWRRRGWSPDGRLGLLFLAIMAGFFANAMFHDMSSTLMTNFLLFFMAGLTSGISRTGTPVDA